VNSGVLCWACCCEPWFAMMSQRVSIMGYYSVPVGVNHGELYWASGCESCCVMLSQWLWMLSIAHHDSHPLGQHNTLWFTTTGSV
jgi:hypothetical protein